MPGNAMAPAQCPTHAETEPMMTQPLFVSQQWLQQHLDDPQLRILDARMLPPGYQGPRDIVAEFRAGHLPGAVFFDIEALSDSASSLPHMLTSPAQFARDMGALGVSDAQHCVIYDDGSLFSAPRAWWMLQSSGVRQVSLLAGALTPGRASQSRWKRDNRRPRRRPLRRA
ncbi:3-mercaptopyruvate sulfurtransferase [Sodalis praecaptivus]